MKLFSNKHQKSLSNGINFVSIFNMKFSLKSYFTGCILGEIADVVNRRYNDIKMKEEIHPWIIHDFQQLQSSIEFIQHNIDTILDLSVEGTAFNFDVHRCETADYQVCITMDINTSSDFYRYLMGDKVEEIDKNFLTSIE